MSPSIQYFEWFEMLRLFHNQVQKKIQRFSMKLINFFILEFNFTNTASTNEHSLKTRSTFTLFVLTECAASSGNWTGCLRLNRTRKFTKHYISFLNLGNFDSCSYAYIFTCRLHSTTFFETWEILWGFSSDPWTTWWLS